MDNYVTVIEVLTILAAYYLLNKLKETIKSKIRRIRAIKDVAKIMKALKNKPRSKNGDPQVFTAHIDGEEVELSELDIFDDK